MKIRFREEHLKKLKVEGELAKHSEAMPYIQKQEPWQRKDKELKIELASITKSYKAAQKSFKESNKLIITQRNQDSKTLLQLRDLISKNEIPAGIKYNETVHRSGSWEIHGGNVSANHRYTQPKVGGLYTAKTQKGVLAEFDYYGLDTSNVKIDVKKINLENALDLTNSTVRDKLGITLGQVVRDDYFLTQIVGEFAIKNGYDGIIVPSARAIEEVNIISFAGL